MSLTATAHSTGDTLRQDVLIDGRHHLITDEPPTWAAPTAVRRRTSCSRPRSRPASPPRSAPTPAPRAGRVGELTIDVVYQNTATPRHFDVTINLPDDLTTSRCAASCAPPRPAPSDAPSKPA